MINIAFLLMILAALCLLLAAGGVTSRVNLGWLGLFFWALTLLIR